MKTKHLLATAACMAAIAMAATSCNNDELPDNNNPGNQTATDNATFTITASTPAEKPTTRLEYKEGVSGTSGLEVKWAKGEEAFVALNVSYAINTKGIKGIKTETAESSKTATFAIHDLSGLPATLEAGTFYALYPAKDIYNGSFEKVYQDILLPLTDQSGKLVDMHNFDYMTALAYINDPNEIPNLSFKRRVAILRLSGLTFQGATGGSATISISGTGLKTEGELRLNANANTNTLEPAGDDGAIATTSTFAIGSDGKLTENVYICFFPPTGGISNLKITATVGDNSYEYSYAGTVGTASNPFEEGYMYTLSDAEMMKSKIVYDYTLEQQKTEIGSKPYLATPGQANSESNPYLITTKEHLQWVKKNAAENNYYKLMKDVEIVDQGGAANWVPIGAYDTSAPSYEDVIKDAFKGHLDGNNMKIIGKIVADKNMDIFGFFGAGATGAGATMEIKNLHMEAKIDVSTITANSPVIGGIIGLVNNGNIEHCTNAAVFSQNSDIFSIGGIAGGCYGNSKITACLNTGNIDISAIGVGGISGDVYESTIIGCINKGTIKTNYRNACAGGIVGFNSTAEVKACWNNATDITNDNGNTATGAIVGGNDKSSISGCYWKNKDGLNGVGDGDGSIDALSTGTFNEDAPTQDQIAKMNDRWQTKDPSRKYQFNPFTGEIEPKP